VRDAYEALTAPPPDDAPEDHRALERAFAALLHATAGAPAQSAAAARSCGALRGCPNGSTARCALPLRAAAGCAPARRLAVAFVPKFAPRAPAQLDAAVAALSAVADAAVHEPAAGAAAAGAPPPPSLAAAARAAAVAGLGSLAGTAAAAHGADSKAAKAAAAALLRRTALLDDPAAPPALAAALAAAPQAVLAALMLACASRDEPRLRQGAASWAAAALAGGAVATALRPAPHTAAWFRAAARAFRAGAPPALALEARAARGHCMHVCAHSARASL
jgi:hypothetical protein